MKTLILTGAALLAVAVSGAAVAKDKMAKDTMAKDHSAHVSVVGGAEMFPTKTIVANAVNSPIHTTLVAAVKQAGLVDTLNGAGPFTVFAPTDEAFGKVPKATVDTLMAPANKATLTKVLTYHVVPGRLSSADLAAKIAAGGGTANLTTAQGETLVLTQKDGKVVITGKGGSWAHVSQADVFQSNGVIHVVDGVLTPTL